MRENTIEDVRSRRLRLAVLAAIADAVAAGVNEGDARALAAETAAHDDLPLQNEEKRRC